MFWYESESSEGEGWKFKIVFNKFKGLRRDFEGEVLNKCKGEIVTNTSAFECNCRIRKKWGKNIAFIISMKWRRTRAWLTLFIEKRTFIKSSLDRFYIISSLFNTLYCTFTDREILWETLVLPVSILASLDSPEDPVAKHRLLVDRLLGWGRDNKRKRRRGKAR